MNTLFQKVRDWIKARMAFVIVVAVLYALFAVVLAILWGNRTPIGNVAVPWDWFWLAAVIGYTLTGITGTGLNERALKLLFGKMPVPEEIPPQRITFVPPGLFQLEKVPIEIQEMELPGEPEQIWRIKDENDEELPLGIGKDGKTEINPPKKIVEREGEREEVILSWVQPIRVLFNLADPAEEQDPLVETANFPDTPEIRRTEPKPSEVKEEDPAVKRVTAEVVGVLQWRVRGLREFLRTYTTFEKARKILADMAVAEMTGVLQAGTAARALNNQELLAMHILRKIRERVDHEVAILEKDEEGEPIRGADGQVMKKTYPFKDKKGNEIERPTVGHPKGDTITCRRGVEIVLFQLKPPNFSHDYNKDVQDVPRAEARAQAKEKDARGDRARMDAYEQKAGTSAGQLMLSLEQLKTIKESIGKKEDKIILIDASNPTASIFGAVVAGKELLAPKRQPAPSPPPGT